MKKFGLIGHPIAHSLSPSLFKAAYDGRYAYDLIEEEDFGKAYERFLEEYDGINVTAPFKEMAFRRADIRTPECEVIGATNLLMKTPEGVKAHNSDYLGVRRWLEERSFDFAQDDEGEGRTEGRKRQGRRVRVLVAGYGGAGKAVAAAAESLEMDVVILNRTCRENHIRPLEDFCKEFRKADIIIYNIPAPIEEMEKLSVEDFRGGETPGPKHILEANYRNRSFTDSLIERMTDANPFARYTGGETWLLYQAVTGYELFTGLTPDLEKMRKVL